VTLCESTDGATCNGAGGWEPGWIMFVDANNNGTREPATEPMITSQSSMPPNYTLRDNSALNYISYIRSGATTQSRTMRLCDNSYPGKLGVARRDIVIILSGRARIATQAQVCP